MNAYHITYFLTLGMIGCGAVEPAARPCGDQDKTEACKSLGADLSPICYDEGEVGPPPYSVGRAWPLYDCAAGPGSKSSDGEPYWFDWWCCAPSTCSPGAYIACGCPQGGNGRQFCDGTGAHYGSCQCDSMGAK